MWKRDGHTGNKQGQDKTGRDRTSSRGTRKRLLSLSLSRSLFLLGLVDEEQEVEDANGLDGCMGEKAGIPEVR